MWQLDNYAKLCKHDLFFNKKNILGKPLKYF